MPSPSQVCKDGDAFENQTTDIACEVGRIRAQLRTSALSKMCLACGEEIPAARRQALPSATTHVDCEAIAAQAA